MNSSEPAEEGADLRPHDKDEPDQVQKSNAFVRCTIVGLVLLMLIAYVSSFAVAISKREPAANLQYFVYSDDSDHDRLLFCGYWPLYFICSRIHIVPRHNLDRPDAKIYDGP